MHGTRARAARMVAPGTPPLGASWETATGAPSCFGGAGAGVAGGGSGARYSRAAARTTTGRAAHHRRRDGVVGRGITMVGGVGCGVAVRAARRAARISRALE